MIRLYKSRSDSKIAGICGGLAEYLQVDSTVIRLVTVLVAIFTAVIPVILVYIIGWIIIPNPPPSGSGIGSGPLT